MASLQTSLRSCVAAAIMPYLEIGFEQYGSETRTLTVMFASLGIELSDSGTKEGRNKI
jgi:adenylate cyclase 10